MRDDEPVTPVDMSFLDYDETDLFDPESSSGAVDFEAPVSPQAPQPVETAAASRKAGTPAATDPTAVAPAATSSGRKHALIGVGAALICGLGAVMLLMALAGSDRPMAAASAHEGTTSVYQEPPGATADSPHLAELYAAFGHRMESVENRMETMGATAEQQRGVLDRIEGSVRDLSQALRDAVQTIGAVEGRLSDVERNIRRLDGMVEAMATRPATATEGVPRSGTAAAPAGDPVRDRPRAWRVIGVMEDRAFVRDVQTGDYQSVEPGTHLPGAGIVRSISSHGQCAVTMEDGSRICNNRIER